MLDTYDIAFGAGGAAGALVAVVLVLSGATTADVLDGTIAYAVLVMLTGAWRLHRREWAWRRLLFHRLLAWRRKRGSRRGGSGS